jgi:hypothetical protein
MTDDTPTNPESDQSPAVPVPQPPSGNAEDEVGATLTGDGRGRGPASGQRSRSLYAVLGIGVASLLVLLGIIYFSATKRENPEQPICTAVTTDRAEQGILAGDVRRIVVNYDNQIESSTDINWGPVLARIDYVDGSCGNLPQGIVAREEMSRILGTAYLYNQITTETQVEIILRGTDALNPSLFVTPTAEPTATPEPTSPPTEIPATPIVIVETPTVAATATPTATATGEPTERSSPQGSPDVASPEGSPQTGTPTATPEY